MESQEQAQGRVRAQKRAEKTHVSPLADLQQEAKAKTGLQTDWPDLKGLPQHGLIGKDGQFFSLPPFLAPRQSLSEDQLNST